MCVHLYMFLKASVFCTAILELGQNKGTAETRTPTVVAHRWIGTVAGHDYARSHDVFPPSPLTLYCLFKRHDPSNQTEHLSYLDKRLPD